MTHRRPGLHSRTITGLIGTICLVLLSHLEPVRAADRTFHFDIPAEALSQALRTFGQTSGEQIIFTEDLVSGLTFKGLRGDFTADAALQRLLEGTGLIAERTPAGVIMIRHGAERKDNGHVPAGAAAAAAAAGGLVAQTGQTPASQPEAQQRQATGAADASSLGLQEVIVTAQKREERLQSVPITVTVFDQTAMDAQGARSMDDLARLTPAITFTHQSTNNNAQNSDIAIRGISSQAGAATTGIYIDDTPIQTRHLSFGSFNTYPELFDIERVEVLEGPQGTLFGSGSEGGTVRFITPEPSLTRASIYARAGAGATAHGDPVYEIGAAGGTPLISDTLGFRASASYRHDGGYIDRVDWRTGQVVSASANAGRTVTARVALKWAATDTFTVTPSVYYQKRDIDDTSAWWYIRPDLAPGDPTGGLFNSPLRSGNEIASPDSDKFVLAGLKLQWTLGAVQLFSNTSYFKRDQAATTDYSQFDRAIFLGNPYPPAGGIGTGYWVDAQENWTQEFRLESSAPEARVLWTAGLFYQHARETTRQNVYDPALQTDLGLPPDFNGGYIYREDPRIGIDKQIAAFGQTDIKVTEALKLTLGLRYAYAQFQGEAHYPTTLVVGPEFDSSGSETEHPLTPKVGLTYQINRDDLVYLTAAKGFRIGGANPAVGQFCYGPGGALEMIGLAAVPPTYSSDSLWSYEIGSKNSFADNRVLLNASAYYIKWKNIQQNVPLTACGFQYTGNLGEARSTGFDLQTVANLTKIISVGANFSYIDAQYTQTVQLAPAVFSIVQDGDRLPASPWAVSAFAQGTAPIGSMKAYARVDYQYSAKQSGTVAAANPLNGGFPAGFDQIPSQSFTSLRAGLNWGGWDVSVYAQNLFDTHPRLGGAAEILAPYSLYTAYSYRPRTVGLTGTYHY
jgi:iron complex outermembrane recepter protein